VRHLALVSMLALSALVIGKPVDAAEGRVSQDSPPPMDAARASKYVGAPVLSDASSTQPLAMKGGRPHSNKESVAAREKRAATISQSVRASDFRISQAFSAFLTDRDSDGFHSEFRIRFNADVISGEAVVYAQLYLRRIGDVDWVLYHTTEDFRINGQSPDDDYFVRTTLDDGFPTADYDVLIDLYESGFNGIVATIGPDESAELAFLPLEEAALDIPIQAPGYAIHDVSTTLLIDSDHDGHYSRFRITFDPDADFAGSFVFARVWVRPQGGQWIEEYVSDDFLVDASGPADAFSVTADWISGYPTAYYDVQIDLHEAATGLLAAAAGSERPALSRIPLEDAERDRAPSPPPIVDSVGDASSDEGGGGGALPIAWATPLLLIAVSRRLARKNRMRGTRSQR
jgi:hypothetical protein